MASDGYTCQSHQFVPHPRQQSSRTSPRHEAVAQTTYVHMDLRLLCGLGHEPQTPTWPLVASQAMVILWDPMQKVKLSSSQAFIVAQSQGGVMAGRQVWGLSLYLHKLQMYISSYVHHPTDPAGQRQHVDLSLLSHQSPQSLLQFHHSPWCTHHSVFICATCPSHICKAGAALRLYRDSYTQMNITLGVLFSSEFILKT